MRSPHPGQETCGGPRDDGVLSQRRLVREARGHGLTQTYQTTAAPKAVASRWWSLVTGRRSLFAVRCSLVSGLLFLQVSFGCRVQRLAGCAAIGGGRRWNGRVVQASQTVTQHQLCGTVRCCAECSAVLYMGLSRVHHVNPSPSSPTLSHRRSIHTVHIVDVVLAIR